MRLRIEKPLMILSLLVLLSSCVDGEGEANNVSQTNSVSSMDSSESGILDEETLASSIWDAGRGDSTAALRIAEHFMSIKGDYNPSSLGWLMYSAELENPLAVQTLISYFTSVGSADGCELAEKWYDQVVGASANGKFIGTHFENEDIQIEYFSTMKEQIDDCRS